MTIKECLDQRIPRVRIATWNIKAYIRLPLLEDGTVGPWAELYDEAGYFALDEDNGSMKLCCVLNQQGEPLEMLLHGDDWEPYMGEPSADEVRNYAASYKEK